MPSTPTSIARVVVSVASLERALPFYEGVLQLPRAYALPGMVMLGTATDQAVEVLLHERPSTPGDAGVAVSFRTGDVDQTTQALVVAGGEVVDPPADQPWGERQAVLHDPDGHVVCIVGPSAGDGAEMPASR